MIEEPKIMEIETEVRNFCRLCAMIIASLFYCYYIVAKIPKGFLRLLFLFPVITLSIILISNLHTIQLGTMFCCFHFALLLGLNLLLFAFDQGPLSPLHKQEDVLCFILMACFSFKVKENPEFLGAKQSKFPSSIIKEAIYRGLVIGVLLYIFSNYIQYLDKPYVLLVFSFYTYHALQLFLFLGAIPAQILLRVEIEPPVNQILSATSLQDFWGHRWNRRVSDLLRDAVHNPIRDFSTSIIGRRWASLPATFLTFFISGLIHEWTYYHVTREPPKWEITGFFILHGVFVDIEIVLKKKLVDTNKFRLGSAVSTPLTLAVLGVTGFWLIYTQIIREGVEEKMIKECITFVDYLKSIAS